MAHPANWPSTITALANRSMAKIGANVRFNDVESDVHPHAQIVRDSLYDAIREMQSEYRWIELKTPAVLSTPDAGYESGSVDGWSYRYVLPDDFLRPLQDMDFEYELFGAFIYCDVAENIKLRYIRYSEDVAEWSSSLYKAVVYGLAMEISLPITQTDVIANGLKAEYENWVAPLLRRIQSYSHKKPNVRARRVSTLGALRRGYR